MQILPFWMSLFLTFYQGQYSQIRETSKKILEQQAARGFEGSALISFRDSILVHNGYGYTVQTKEYPISSTTLFNIASMSKTITAVAIMQLVEQGKLDLSTPLSLVFQNNLLEEKREITIHQLLTHSSGLPQKYVTSGISDGEKAMKRIWKTKLDFSPGTGFGYSNLNYQVLARIIEIYTNQSFEEYCHENIFRPSRMRNSFFWNEVDQGDSRSVAEMLQPFKSPVQARNWDFLGSGGVFSCSQDLYSFYRAFSESQLVNEESKHIMLTPYLKIRENLFMGYGWFIVPDSKGKMEYWTRGSESFGHNGVLRWFPGMRLVIIIQSNTGENGSPTQTDNRLVSDELVQAIFNELED